MEKLFYYIYILTVIFEVLHKTVDFTCKFYPHCAWRTKEQEFAVFENAWFAGLYLVN